jgi:hypothetical protein
MRQHLARMQFFNRIVLLWLEEIFGANAEWGSLPRFCLVVRFLSCCKSIILALIIFRKQWEILEENMW